MNIKSKIIVVILSAGKGIRLQEYTTFIPKPLLKLQFLNNKSILQHTLESLINLGIQTIVIIKGHLGRKIDEFKEELSKENPVFYEHVKVINAGDEYNLGPLYSFLSITKIKSLFSKNFTYLIIPGDTIFQFNLWNEIINMLDPHKKYVLHYPILFYRKTDRAYLQQNFPSKTISIAKLKSIQKKSYLKQIVRVDFSSMEQDTIMNQIVPISILSYKFVREIMKLIQNSSINTIWEMINYMVEKGTKVLTMEVDSNNNFYDIDSISDIKFFENK